jgi:thiol-disulfide isomerase/thioredoxin
MKSILLAITALFVSVNIMAQGIEFEHGTFAEALAKAKSENKMVFMDCYTSWCGPCKMLAKNVFPQKEVGDVFNKQFVNFKIDCEKGEGPEIAKKYGVNAYPTMLFLDGEGKVVHKIVGGTSVEGIIEHAGIAVDPSKQIAALHKKYDEGNRDLGFLGQYAQALRNDNNMPKLNALAEEFMSNTPAEDMVNIHAFIIIALSQSLEYGSDVYKQYIANKDKLIAIEGVGEQGYQYVVGRCVEKHLRNTAKESETLEALHTEMEKVKKEYQAPQQEVMEKQMVSHYYLMHKETEKWFDLQLEMAEEAKAQNNQMSERILSEAIYMVSYDVPSVESSFYKKVMKVTKDLIQSNADNAQAHHVMAKLYIKAGDKDKALSSYNTLDAILARRGVQNNRQAAQLKKDIDAM